MLKNKKIIWTIVLLLIVVGIVLMIMGFGLGAKHGIYVDKTGIHIMDDEKREMKKDLEEIKSIRIDSKYVDIEICESNKYYLEIVRYGEQIKIDWELNNKELEISEKYNDGFKLFNIDLGFINGIKRSYIKIGVPKDESLEDIFIKSNSGDIIIKHLDTNNIKIDNKYGKIEIDNNNNKSENIEIKNNSGDILLKNIESEIIILENEYGDIKLNNVYTKDSNIQLNSGRINLEDCISDKLIANSKYGNIQLKNVQIGVSDLELNSGQLDINGILLGDTNIKSKYGKININTKQPLEYYTCDFNTKYGNIKVNGDKNKDDGKYVTTNNGEYLLKIEANSGNIIVNFDK